MNPIDFPQRNLMLAANQPQYETLPVHVEMTQRLAKNKIEGFPDKAVQTTNVPWSMTACFELSEEEIEEIVRTKKLWYRQMVYGNPFQPVMLSTQNPFTKLITEDN